MLQTSLEAAHVNLHTAVGQLLCFGSPRHKFFHEESLLPFCLVGGEKTNETATVFRGLLLSENSAQEERASVLVQFKKTDLSKDTEAATQIVFNTAASCVFRSQP